MYGAVLKVFVNLKRARGNFTLPLQDPPYLIIAGNCQGNMKLNLKSYKWGKPPTPRNSIPVYYNKKEKNGID